MRFVETIHKKNGRLHIYVRQDKYKGELKSHNWVGRTYIDGKQKIVSSGTPDLEKAIVILEKWFDDLQIKKEQKQAESTAEDNKTQTVDNVTKTETETLEKIERSAIQDQYEKQTEIAKNKGIFGSPSFIVGDEVFWGDDRLENAIEWASGIIEA